MPPHCDANNIGPSYILAVGTDGTLQIHDAGEVKTYDIHNKILKFDGHSLKHSCDYSGQGTRISFVVYHRPPRGTKPQRKKQKLLYVLIACISRTLSPAERRWTVHEREALGVIWALSKLKSYLFSAKFLIETDHRNLLWLLRLKEDKGKLSRWGTLISQWAISMLPGARAKGTPVHHDDAECLEMSSTNSGEGTSEGVGNDPTLQHQPLPRI
mmetsp:Transcript_4951/g.14668  ORF Transcript_4951/g.14668 Transcript_4951/m.14668 type:complete len:213 (+) Transcript_4951:431-1069(+)